METPALFPKQMEPGMSPQLRIAVISKLHTKLEQNRAHASDLLQHDLVYGSSQPCGSRSGLGRM